MDPDKIIGAWESMLSGATAPANRAKVARRVKSRERALEWGIKQIVKGVRDGSSDWPEALEISLQRMERKAKEAQQRAARADKREPGGALAVERADQAESEQEGVREFARFAQIYADELERIEPVLRAARREAAKRIVAEFPESGDAEELAKHLRKNTPSAWLAGWDANDL